MTQISQDSVPIVIDRQRAAIVALLVAAVLVAQQLVNFIASVIVFSAGGDTGNQFLGQVGYYALATAIPFAAGVFVGFGLVLPLGSALGLRQAILRSIVAAAIGAAAVAIVAMVVGSIMTLSQGIPFFGNSFPASSYATAMGQSILRAISGGVGMFVGSLPLVVLAGILYWIWLGRRP